jgi:YfiR/HmsC-like
VPGVSCSAVVAPAIAPYLVMRLRQSWSRQNFPRIVGAVRLAVAFSFALLFASNLLAGLLPALPPGPPPDQAKPSEYTVKAAYLLNFGKFMRVSPGAETSSNNFNICIVGDDPFGGALDNITAGEQIDGRPVRIVRLQKPDLDKPDSRACAIAYLSASEDRRIEQDLAAMRDSDTLTVSDAPDFLKRGGMIQFLLVSNHVRFSVNLDPVRRTHLNLSSELLRVAASVSGNRPGEVQP